MPKIVDHEQRRQELIETAAEVIAERGLEHTTLRDVAAKAGYSANLVAHYFDNKDALLYAVQHFVGQRAARRFLQSKDQSLPAIIESVLPFDEDTQVEWKVRACFWSRSVVDTAMIESQETLLTQVRKDMAKVVVTQQRAGLVRDDIDVAMAVERLFNLANSISMQVLLEPKRYSPAFCRKLIRNALADLM